MKPTTANIVIAAIGALATIIAALIAHGLGAREARDKSVVVSNVFDASTSAGIPNAVVEITGEKVLQRKLTDTTGRATFEISGVKDSQLVTIQASHQGYAPQTFETRLQIGFQPYQFRLRPDKPTVSSAPPTPKFVSKSRVFSSGPRISGASANFSPWYRLCSEALQSPAKIVSSRFSLSGDRSCGGWANCRAVIETELQVCWEFQMQGHNEWPYPGQAFSEGILTIEYIEPAA